MNPTYDEIIDSWGNHYRCNSKSDELRTTKYLLGICGKSMKITVSRKIKNIN